MTDTTHPQPGFPKGVIIFLVIFASFFIIIPLLIILFVIAIIAINPAGHISSPPQVEISPNEVFSTPIYEPTPTQYPTNQTNPSLYPSNNPYIGWITHDSIYNNIKFKYPSNFKVFDNPGKIRVEKSTDNINIARILFTDTPFDVDSFSSHNFRQKEKDRHLQIGTVTYPTLHFLWEEGSPGQIQGTIWKSSVEVDIVELPSHTLELQFFTDKILDSDGLLLQQTTPSEEDRHTAELILKSMEFK